MTCSQTRNAGLLSDTPDRSSTRRRMTWLLFGVFAFVNTGCALFDDLGAIPLHRVPPQFLDVPRKRDLIDVSFERLRQRPPEVYRLDAKDILGIYIENVLGTSEELPPVHFPEDQNVPPAIGFPVPVREDGTISLPLVEPLNVRGMTMIEATNRIRKAYTIDSQILKEGKDRIIVTLIRQRTTRILVVREEFGAIAHVTKRGTGHIIDLPAYENDVLHALSHTGGLPGIDAINEVLVYRGMYEGGSDYEALVQELSQRHFGNQGAYQANAVPDPPNLLRIPLSYHPSYPPSFTEENIILNEGDIVLIKSREDEMYYTGGILQGREIRLPRDKDLDVLAAVALAGGSIESGSRIASPGFGGMGGGGGGLQGVPASQLIVLRQLPGDQQIAIKIDTRQAIRDPRLRIFVQPNDTLIMRYTLEEQFTNFLLNIVQYNLVVSGLNRGLR